MYSYLEGHDRLDSSFVHLFFYFLLVVELIQARPTAGMTVNVALFKVCEGASIRVCVRACLCEGVFVCVRVRE